VRAEVDLAQLAVELLGPGGRLTEEKTFTRADVVVAVAPHLHGHPVSLLDEAVAAVLGSPDAIALPPVAGSREEGWAPRCVLVDEERVAALADSLAASPGPAVGEADAEAAIAGVERELVGELLGATSLRRQPAVRRCLHVAADSLAVEPGHPRDRPQAPPRQPQPQYFPHFVHRDLPERHAPHTSTLDRAWARGYHARSAWP
jgi:hypothetical protein